MKIEETISTMIYDTENFKNGEIEMFSIPYGVEVDGVMKTLHETNMHYRNELPFPLKFKIKKLIINSSSLFRLRYVLHIGSKYFTELNLCGNHKIELCPIILGPKQIFTWKVTSDDLNIKDKIFIGMIGELTRPIQ